MDYVYFSVKPKSEAAKVIAKMDAEGKAAREAWKKFMSQFTTLPDGYLYYCEHNRLTGWTTNPMGVAMEWCSLGMDKPLPERDEKDRVNTRVTPVGTHSKDLWRWDGQRGAVVPMLRMPAGKSLSNQMAALPLLPSNGTLTYLMLNGKATDILMPGKMARFNLTRPKGHAPILGVPWGLFADAEKMGNRATLKDLVTGLTEMKQSKAVLLVNGAGAE
jgi:hypothetical protein